MTKPVEGHLAIFQEAFTEGPACCVIDPSKNDAAGKYTFEGTHFFKKGDFLVIFSDASKRHVLFEGNVDMLSGIQSPQGIKQETWLSMFDQGLPCLYTPTHS